MEEGEALRSPAKIMPVNIQVPRESLTSVALHAVVSAYYGNVVRTWIQWVVVDPIFRSRVRVNKPNRWKAWDGVTGRRAAVGGI